MLRAVNCQRPVTSLRRIHSLCPAFVNTRCKHVLYSSTSFVHQLNQCFDDYVDLWRWQYREYEDLLRVCRIVEEAVVKLVEHFELSLLTLLRTLSFQFPFKSSTTVSCPPYFPPVCMSCDLLDLWAMWKIDSKIIVPKLGYALTPGFTFKILLLWLQSLSRNSVSYFSKIVVNFLAAISLYLEYLREITPADCVWLTRRVRSTAPMYLPTWCMISVV